MIEYKTGNLVDTDAQALVNTVNCVGVMGKGIALQFKMAFPDNFRVYAKACRNGEMRLGHVLVVPTHQSINPHYIFNFPTKYHWRGKSNIEDIRAGLNSLIDEVTRLNIGSIAVPALGCGNGGLDWSQVKGIIEQAFDKLPGVQVYLFEPQEAPETEAMKVGTKQPKMTRGRAIILVLLDHYQAISNDLGMTAIQKLVYFLQKAGEPLKLEYSKGSYGPYSENLHHVLQNMEGHYIRGYGDRSRRPNIRLAPEAVALARQYIADLPEVKARLERVKQLIAGYETNYGMELLATIDWVAFSHMLAKIDADEAVKQVQDWSKRKAERFKRQHISEAWQRLHDEGWLAG
jgi:O-acetyl-ADP-ribose deacetylase (regulator of RNase III)/uncharacterized protein YwgA